MPWESLLTHKVHQRWVRKIQLAVLYVISISTTFFPIILLTHLLPASDVIAYLIYLISTLYLISYLISGGTLLTLLSKFATCVSNSVDGKGSTDGGVEMSELYGGARISYIFNEVRIDVS